MFQILEGAQRHFWISCNHGIYRVSKDELNDFAAGRRSAITSIAYGKSDGMLNVECNGGRSPAGIKTQDGKLWFPTQDGIAVIDPGKVTIRIAQGKTSVSSTSASSTMRIGMILSAVSPSAKATVVSTGL